MKFFFSLKFVRLCFIIICIDSALIAQNDAIYDAIEANSYIEKFPDAITVRFEFNDHINSFNINDKDNDLQYSVIPNLEARTAFSVQFRAIDVEIGYTPKFLRFTKVKDVFGKTKTFDLVFKTLIGQWLQGVQFSKTKGYYVEDINIDLGGEVLTFPDLKITYIGGSTGYIFNKNFSYRATTTQTEWQKKSAGSFVPSVQYFYTRFSDVGSDNTTSLDFIVTPAYFYNFVFKENFLFALGATGGIGINISKTEFKEENFNESITSLSTSVDFSGGIGYNSNKFYSGISANLQVNNHNDSRHSGLQDNQFFGEFFVGYRFDAPKIVLETADKVNTFLNLK